MIHWLLTHRFQRAVEEGGIRPNGSEICKTRKPFPSWLSDSFSKGIELEGRTFPFRRMAYPRTGENFPQYLHGLQCQYPG